MFVPTLLGDATITQTVAAGTISNSILASIGTAVAQGAALIGNLVKVVQLP
jgi:hypothetical protein